MNKSTQEEKILTALKECPDGLHPTFFIQDLFIYQYLARINGLRKRFGCECKNGRDCMATEHIVNKRLTNGTTKFFYKKTAGPDWEGMRKEVVEKLHTEDAPQEQGTLL